MSYFTNTKDKIPLLSQSSEVYKFVCPGCCSSYIGKRTALYGREQKNMPIRITIKKNKVLFMNTCQNVNITITFKFDNDSFNLNQFNIFQIRNNTAVIDRATNRNVLLFKEAYI